MLSQGLGRFNVSVGRTDPRYFVGMPITAGAACVAAFVVAWPDRPTTTLHAAGIVALLFVVGSLMVSTVRFPSSKQKMSMGLVVVLLINVGLLEAEDGYPKPLASQVEIKPRDNGNILLLQLQADTR